MEKYTALAGRAFLSAIFLMSGLGKIANFEGTRQYMEAYGMPLTALFAAGAIAFEVLGGLSLLLGFKARWGAWVLFLFLIPVTLIFHALGIGDPEQGQMQVIHTLKNLAIMGGLLTAASFGPGELSLDAKKSLK